MIKSTDEDEEAITGLLDTDAKTNSETTGTSGGSSDGNKESIVMGGTDIPLCGILSVKFYKPYFDVDTKDITNRLYHALVSFKDASFMGMISEKPDAYGPFWIATSLIFVVAVSSHISSFLTAWMLGKGWAYDFQSFLTLASMVYSFLAGVPLAMWFGIRQFNSKFKLITALCLYGYSFMPFIPAAALSVFPSQIFPFPYAWLLFLGAGSISILFLLRNLAPTIVESTGDKAIIFLGILALVQFTFTLMVKFNYSSH